MSRKLGSDNPDIIVFTEIKVYHDAKIKTMADTFSLARIGSAQAKTGPTMARTIAQGLGQT